MKPIITKSFPAQASANEKFSEKNAGVKFAIGESSLGSILVECGDQGVRAIFLDDSAEELVRDLQAQLPETPLTGDNAVCRNYVSQVAAFIEAPRKTSICHWTPGEFLRVLEASAVRASRVGTGPFGFLAASAKSRHEAPLRRCARLGRLVFDIVAAASRCRRLNRCTGNCRRRGWPGAGADPPSRRPIRRAKHKAVRMLLWNQASADPTRAAEALTKIEAREARLLGLDMPTKAAVTDPDGNGIPRRERIKEAVAAAHTAKPGLLVFGSTHWSQTPWLQAS